MIDIKSLKSYSKKYIQNCTSVMNILFKELEEKNKTVYDADAKLIVNNFFKINHNIISLNNESDEEATENFKKFWNNMISDCERFIKNDRLFAVIASTHSNQSYRKIAAKLQHNLSSIDDLADYTQNELCEMLKKNKIGLQGIMTTIDMMYEFEVSLKDCPTRGDMMQFHKLLEIIASKRGE